MPTETTNPSIRVVSPDGLRSWVDCPGYIYRYDHDGVWRCYDAEMKEVVPHAN